MHLDLAEAAAERDVCLGRGNAAKQQNAMFEPCLIECLRSGGIEALQSAKANHFGADRIEGLD